MLEVKHLHKSFGKLIAVDDVSFTIEPGTIMGIIGQNGSGKTTIFRMILDFLTPENHGEVLWNGKVMSEQVQDVVGYLPEERGLYEKMTIEQQILYFAQLRGMERKEILSKIDEWMIRFNVKGKKTDKIKSLSKGNQQKVQLIATLIHEPKLVILDEPFSGLDPVNADFLKKGILALRDKGACIIFSSHNMNNVEEICDKLVMIHNGKQVLYGPVDEVRNSFGRTKVLVESTFYQLEDIQKMEGIKSVEMTGTPNQYLVHLVSEEFGQVLFDSLSHGQYLPVFYQQAPSLEEIFKMKAGEAHE